MSTTETAREVIERTWNAPIETVWALWTTAEGVASWYGPRGFRADITALDARPGGPFHCTMVADSPDAIARMEGAGRPTSWPNIATFTEVVHHRRLVFEMDVPMGPGQVATMVHTVDFEPTPGGVHMVFTIEAASRKVLGGAAMGWRSSMDRFAEQLPA